MAHSHHHDDQSHQHGMQNREAFDTATVFDEAFWDARYDEADAVWSGNVNPHLLSTADSLQAGDALDIGSGEGADSVWLARKGWRVTAVDISGVALSRGAASIGSEPEIAARITWEKHDLLTWAPPLASFDLVTSQYMHLPRPDMHRLVAAMAAAVRPGGTLVVVGHDLSDGRPFGDELFFTGDELAEVLRSFSSQSWDVVDTVSRTHPTREGVDAILLARRVS